MDPAHEALRPAIRRVLVPLVRLLLRFGVTLPTTVELLKSVYVEVAEREFRLAGRRQTNSRISLISGVHRKDVRRLLDTPASTSAVPNSVSVGARVVAHWLAHFTDEEGTAQVLRLRAENAGTATFEQLVESALGKDLRPRVVLDELLNLGVVVLEPDNGVRLRALAFVPEQGFDEKAYYYGANLHDHAAASGHNVAGGEPPFLDRAVSYHGLSNTDVETLRAEASALSDEVLAKLNRRALAMKTQNAGRTQSAMRMRYGVYFYCQPDDEDPNASANPAPESVEPR
ncbi:MAG: hypothetical protein K0U93_10365 [Gammaproteobacteria bacterium]|nr:hypothetical protein [Gammaproteobacteria bacterium]